MTKKLTLAARGFPILLGIALTSCGGDAGYNPHDPTTSYWHITTNGAMPKRKPGPSLIVVERGDTLYSIARHHDIDVQSLIEANDLVEPFALSPGQSLRLPSVRLHAVQKGETIYSISKAKGVDTLSLALMNDIQPPYTIVIGQKLRLPGSDDVTYTDDVWQEDEIDWVDQDVGATVVSRSTSGGRFMWPVNGQIISTYGPKKGGLHNDGMNIAAKAGSPVFASDDGVVSYVGNELRGYGNLVLIRHTDDWISAYSHNGVIRVTKGEQVRRGQHIADTGQTGNVDRPQLHFELRKKSRTVDPARYLPSQ